MNAAEIKAAAKAARRASSLESRCSDLLSLPGISVARIALVTSGHGFTARAETSVGGTLAYGTGDSWDEALDELTDTLKS